MMLHAVEFETLSKFYDLVLKPNSPVGKSESVTAFYQYVAATYTA